MDIAKIFEEKAKLRLKNIERKLNYKFELFKTIKNQNHFLTTVNETIKLNNSNKSNKLRNKNFDYNKEVDRILEKVEDVDRVNKETKNFESKISLIPFMIQISNEKDILESGKQNFITKLNKGIFKKDVDFIKKELYNNDEALANYGSQISIASTAKIDNKKNDNINFEEEFNNLYNNHLNKNNTVKFKTKSKLKNIAKTLNTVNYLKKIVPKSKKEENINNIINDIKIIPPNDNNRKNLEDDNNKLLEKSKAIQKLKNVTRIKFLFLGHLLITHNKKIIKQFASNIYKLANDIIYKIKKDCISIFNTLWSHKTPLLILNDEEIAKKLGFNNITSNEISENIKIVYKNIEKFINLLNKSFTNNTSVDIQIKKMYTILFDNTKLIFPQNFLFDYEIERVNIMKNGHIVLTDESKKMVLSVFIIIKLVIKHILVCPWDLLSTIKPTNILRYNIYVYTSIIDRLITNWVTNNTTVNQRDYNKLVIRKFRLKPRQKIYTINTERNIKSTDNLNNILTSSININTDITNNINNSILNTPETPTSLKDGISPSNLDKIFECMYFKDLEFNVNLLIDSIYNYFIIT